MSYIDYSGRVLSTFRSGIEYYRDEVDHAVTAGMRILHLGCGRDLNEIARPYTGKCAVVGVDTDIEALHRYPGEAWHADARDLPFRGGSFDLVVSEYVLEHLAEPRQVFSEVGRVLRRGGCFISLAPNLWSYKSLAAYCSPHWFHEIAVRVLRRDSARASQDVYPTVFRANTRRALRRLAVEAGLEVERLTYVDNGPTWFQRLPGLFELGRVYHAALGWNALAGLRCNIVVTLRRTSA